MTVKMEDRIKRAVCHFDENISVKKKQMEALCHILNGDNVLINLSVGYGKSLIYHVLPELLKTDQLNQPIVIVISPLNIIQKDQLSTLSDHSVPSCRLNIETRLSEFTDDGRLYQANSDQSLEDVIAGRFRLVFCHPEALLNTILGRTLLDNDGFCSKVVAVVVDECHILDKWGEEFRTAFKKLSGIKAFFPNVPLIGMSGTLTTEQKRTIPKQLGLDSYKLTEETPDRPNIFLEKYRKVSGSDVTSEYETIVHELCNKLYEQKNDFPVTLLFIPVHYMSEGLMYLQSLFQTSNINEAIYSAICSGQDEYVINTTIEELKKEDPRIRLVLTTSISGMGFDPRNVTCVVHTCPPRNASQYLQEIGRAGRQGQSSRATLYFGNRDIATNLPGIKEDIITYCKTEDSCLRNCLLSVFGFEKDTSITDCKCCSYCRSQCFCEECVDI